MRHKERDRNHGAFSRSPGFGVGPNSFCVTNDHRYPSGWRRTLEDYLRLRRSNVLYYDGSKFVEAASGIGYANGINVGHDGRTLYVCSITEGGLPVYDRDPASAGSNTGRGLISTQGWTTWRSMKTESCGSVPIRSS